MTDWKDILAGLTSPADIDADIDADKDEASEHITPKQDKAITRQTHNDHDNTAGMKTPTLTLFYEKKGRAGKPATIITGFDHEDPDALERADTLASTLKKKLGCGGSARGGEILLQGNRLAELRKLLPTLGYTKIKG